MFEHKNLPATKFILPAAALILASTSFLSFKAKENKEEAQTAALTTTLTFKYQLGTYDEADVESNINWQKVNPGDACIQEDDDAACSFSISVPTGNEPLYLNGNQPSARVVIEADQNTSTSNYFVDMVQEKVSGVTGPIPHSASNINP